MSEMPKLLTEPEVAEMLRCTPRTVARLRKAGMLTFIPGRPVRIDEADVWAYIESIKVAATVKVERPAPASASDEHALTPEEHARIKQLVRKKWLQRKMRERSKRL